MYHVRLTARLRLQPITPDDAEALRLLHADPDVATWYAGVWDLAEAHCQATAMSRRWAEDGVGKWLAFRRDDNALVGRGGLSRSTVDGDRVLEVGWAVRGEFQGQGYATEFGRAALDAAFGELDADQVVSFTEVHNVRSRAVMSRLGLRYEREIILPGLVAGCDGVQPEARFALYAIGRGTGDTP